MDQNALFLRVAVMSPLFLDSHASFDTLTMHIFSFGYTNDRGFGALHLGDDPIHVVQASSQVRIRL